MARMRLTGTGMCVAAALVGGSAWLWAQQSPTGRVATLTPRFPATPAGGAVAARSTSVIGFAWTPTNAPIPHAPVQLRNVTSGRVEARAVTDASGRFVFQDVEGNATYVVELLDERGRVIALGQPFALAPGETVATFVRLAARAPWFAGLFDNTAAAVVSTAASLGVTAVAPSNQPASSFR